MAKYLGLLTADARGKIGGVIMSRAQGATTLKGHRKPKHPGSFLQQAHQGRMGSALGAWRDLNQYEQQSWIVFASGVTYTNSLGSLYSPTGLQLYTQAYLNASYANATPPNTIPLDTRLPPSLYTVALSARPGLLRVDGETLTGPYVGLWSLYLSRPISPSLNYVRTIARRFMVYVTNETSSAVWGAYVAAYGQGPVSGQRIALRALPVDPVTYISGAQLIATATVSAI